MTRHIDDPGAVLASTVTTVAALGFVPVAAHFNFFSVLVKIGPVASAEALTSASDAQRTDQEKQCSPLCLRLTQDTMFAMAGLGFVDLVDDDTYQANSITNHIDSVPSAIHGMLHFTTEPLFAAAFLMRELVDTSFKYPFSEKDTPTQYGYRLLGEHKYANEHTYSIMHMQGRLSSFNIFMEGKFGHFGTMPERVRSFGYDLENVLTGTENEVRLIDIGGGQGQMLLEVKEAFPHLSKSNLVLQEYNPDMQRTDELTIVDWDFKSDTSQPIRGALVYSLTHIYHNLPDLNALQLMQKIAEAMEPHSRMLIHEFSRNQYYGKMHATMIELYGGRIRSSREWHQMAALCGLEITFEIYPIIGEGLIEMRKLSDASRHRRQA